MRHFNLSDERATELYVQSGFGKKTQLVASQLSNAPSQHSIYPISLKGRDIAMSSCEDEEIDELMGDDDLNEEFRKQMQDRTSVIPAAVRRKSNTNTIPNALQERHDDEVEPIGCLMQQSNKETRHDEMQMPSHFRSCGLTDMSAQSHLLQGQCDQQRRIIEVLEHELLVLRQTFVQLQRENEDLKSDNDQLKLELTEGWSRRCSKST